MNNKEKNFVSAVIYVHNAEQHIEKFLKTIIETMLNNFEHSEIICVNDDSTDNSVNIIKKVSREIAELSISVINMSCFHGLELAMNAGMDLSIGDFVFQFDTSILDFNHDEIMRVYHRALEGYDIVSASSDAKERLSSKLFYKAFNLFSNQPYSMSTESFRVLSRRVINKISSMNNTVPYRKAVYANCGLNTDNLKYHACKFVSKKTDKKEKSYKSGLAIESLILFTEVGYRLSIIMTLLMTAVSIFMVIYSIIIYMTSSPVEGWTTTILFLSVAFGGLFGILTIIIKYLQLLVDLVFKRKNYSYESIEKLK